MELELTNNFINYFPIYYNSNKKYEHWALAFPREICCNTSSFCEASFGSYKRVDLMGIKTIKY